MPGHEDELLEWMKDFNLLCNNVKCIKQGPDCAMMWSPTRVVDKFQWQCSSCHNKVHIRQNSFFKNVFCPLPIAIKVILAWCQDLDFSEVAIALGKWP